MAARVEHPSFFSNAEFAASQLWTGPRFDEPLEGRARFFWEWAPSEPGFVPQPLEGAPAPAAAKTGRELQMRALAKRFSCEQTWLGDRAQLRLLTTPVWQYEAGDEGLSTGGLFVFTHDAVRPVAPDNRSVAVGIAADYTASPRMPLGGNRKCASRSAALSGSFAMD